MAFLRASFKAAAGSGVIVDGCNFISSMSVTPAWFNQDRR